MLGIIWTGRSHVGAGGMLGNGRLLRLSVFLRRFWPGRRLSAGRRTLCGSGIGYLVAAVGAIRLGNIAVIHGITCLLE